MFDQLKDFLSDYIQALESMASIMEAGATRKLNQTISNLRGRINRTSDQLERNLKLYKLREVDDTWIKENNRPIRQWIADTNIELAVTLHQRESSVWLWGSNR